MLFLDFFVENFEFGWSCDEAEGDAMFVVDVAGADDELASADDDGELDDGKDEEDATVDGGFWFGFDEVAVRAIAA